MDDYSAFLDMKRYKNWAHKIGSRVNSASFMFAIMNSFHGCVENQQLKNDMVQPL